ncbi:MAG: hypothetical protein ACXWUH_09575 [Burkholderiales bacterium]
MKFHTAKLIGLLAIASGAHAQDSIVGTYNASYSTKGIQATLVSVSIVISSVEDGVVKGTGIRRDRACAGEYPLQGTLKGDQLRLRATAKGGPTGDCSFGFAGTVQGNALVGKYGPLELEFRK